METALQNVQKWTEKQITVKDRCLLCGEEIPEGRQVCRNCEVRAMNKEGYPDPTAERAVHNASRMPKHIRSIYKMLNAAAGVSGLEIIGLRDKETGREYRR